MHRKEMTMTVAKAVAHFVSLVRLLDDTISAHQPVVLAYFASVAHILEVDSATVTLLHRSWF